LLSFFHCHTTCKLDQHLSDQCPQQPTPPAPQVHRATLRRPDGSVRPVAVKVRHPSVSSLLALDFRLLALLADALGRVPALKGLSLRQSVAQFTATMTAQCDLRVEAVHAVRFARNFQGGSVFTRWCVG
jgi:predicted unusual protein kinase regulating ubiquinone biosynthesis (AarF/ABC1/UbiB family)